MKTLAIHFANLGPYHLARLESAVEALCPMGWRVVAFEIAGSDENYGWSKRDGRFFFERVTVFPNAAFQRIGGGHLRQRIQEALDTLQPTAMAIAGWGTLDARLCLRWCKRNGVKAIVMSETRAADGQRVWWREWFKSRIVRRFDAALCGGESHKRYLVHLGIPDERVAYGYNVVDNAFFAEGPAVDCGELRTEEKAESGNAAPMAAGAGQEDCQKWTEGRDELERTSEKLKAPDDGRLAHDSDLPAGPYFLASCRFIRRKNVETLIQAYYLYSTLCKSEIWPLVLLGDGELKEGLIERGRELQMRVKVEKAEMESSSSSAKSQHANADFPRCADCLSEFDGYRLFATRLVDRFSEFSSKGLVVFAGFRQLEELPEIYHRAGAFIHPALEEPWGLVINEAMASGLPILSSRNVGAAEELLSEADNGFLFDPKDSYQIARYMGLISRLPLGERLAMGEKSREIVEMKAPKRAFGLGLKKLLAAENYSL